jgi:hypothetical protein
VSDAWKFQRETDDPASWARSAYAALVSFERDAARWTLSYTEHTATALRRRALSAQNGK